VGNSPAGLLKTAASIKSPGVEQPGTLTEGIALTKLTSCCSPSNPVQIKVFSSHLLEIKEWNKKRFLLAPAL
jgi:hypothetical protein